MIVVFLLASAFYLWIAGTSTPIVLHGWRLNGYDRLADAFLHLRLSVGPAPHGLLTLSDPYDPLLNVEFRREYGIHDFLLYRGKLYLPWGPTPALVLMVPMRLLGLDPAPSLIASIFAILGLGFTLATFRLIVRQIGDVALWMAVLGALALALSSTIPFILRRPLIYEEAISCGYCFAMAGVWLAVRSLIDRQAPLWRLALISLCFGLAAGSRPTLALAALVMVPLYLALRSSRPGLGLASALSIPIGVCFLLLLAYNQARFGEILEIGAKYQLSGYNSRFAALGSPSYVLPGLWYYVLSPPGFVSLFPFLLLGPPPDIFPLTLPKAYTGPEITGGLLPMTPILIFLAGLPRIWRRHPASLGPLAPFLLVLAGAGIGSMLYVSFEFFSTTERYEVDFSTFLLLGSLAAWLAIARHTRGYRRRLIRVGGGLLVTWGCLTGIAISFVGYENRLAVTHPGIWRTLQKISSPLSTAIVAAAEGHPVIAEISAPYGEQAPPTKLVSLEAGAIKVWLGRNERADLSIISPGARNATLLARMVPGTVPRAGSAGRNSPHAGGGISRAFIGGPGGSSHEYSIPTEGRLVRILVRLKRGLNDVLFRASTRPLNPATKAKSVLIVTKLALTANH